MSNNLPYGYAKTFENLEFDEALSRVTAALKDEGFGVLTEIDVKAAMKAKLGADFRRYLILGACKPPLAYQALQGEPHIGLLLPCNVVVAEPISGRGTVVSVIKASALFALVGNDQVAPIAQQVDESLQRVLAAIGG